MKQEYTAVNTTTIKTPYIHYRFQPLYARTSMDYEGNQIPYVFHCEGIVYTKSRFRPARGGCPAELTFRAAIGRNPWYMLGDDAVAEQAGNLRTNKERPFVRVVILGAEAERLQNIQKGARIFFTGKPEKIKRKGCIIVQVIADCVYQIASRMGAPDEIRREVSCAVNCFELRGETRLMPLGTISGDVVATRPMQKTHSGQDVISAQMRIEMPALEANARINETYDWNADYGTRRIVTVSVIGKGAGYSAKRLIVGNKLIVTGRSFAIDCGDGTKNVLIDARAISVLEQARYPGDISRVAVAIPAAALAALS